MKTSFTAPTEPGATFSVSYKANNGTVYTSSDGKTFASPDGTSYLSADGKTISFNGVTYTLTKTQHAPLDLKALADLVCRLNSGGNSQSHLEAWAAEYGASALTAFATERRAAEKAATDARRATLKAQLADLEA